MSVSTRRIAVVTGTRAEFGLLRPVMRAIDAHPDLDLEVLVTGTHLLPDAHTETEVARAFALAARIPMQAPGENGRASDALAFGRGVHGFAERFVAAPPHVVLVLGDRIEAFAAATAASVAGLHVAHVHGGDRAEGIADEGIRHAISKLAQIHFPASAESAERLICMGEHPMRVHLVGSPAIDELDDTPALSDQAYADLGSPRIVFLLHPSGLAPELEHARAARALSICAASAQTLALAPNHDAGRDAITQAIAESGLCNREHLDRETFVGLLRRADVLVGNSSAGLIEAAALGLFAINLGQRQAGRQMPPHVLDIADWHFDELKASLAHALTNRPAGGRHPYGRGTAGTAIASFLASADLSPAALFKRNTY